MQVDTLYCGEVGYLAAQIKSVQDARVGDTVTLKRAQAEQALDGYEDVQPMVYCGLFPTDTDDYQVRTRERQGRGARWSARAARLRAGSCSAPRRRHGACRGARA